MAIEGAIAKIVGYMAAPIVALAAFMGKRLHNRVDRLEQKVGELEKSNAVQQSQLADLKEDISSINVKLDKILDKLTR